MERDSLRSPLIQPLLYLPLKLFAVLILAEK